MPNPSPARIAVDTHVDTILRMIDLGEDLGRPGTSGYMDLPAMREGGLDAAFFACCVTFDLVALGRAAARAVELIEGVHELCARFPNEIALARTAREVRANAAKGRRAAVITIEGGHALEGDLGRLADWHARGVRAIGLTHFNTNDLADSATDVSRHGGLSALGRQAIAEMNRLRILIDVSHASDDAFWQALELSRQPILASHSSARSLTAHPRNLTDEMIRALAAKGGVIGVTCWPEYISEAYNRALSQHCAATAPQGREGGAAPSAIAELLARIGNDPIAAYNVLMTAGVPFPSLQDYVEHIVHVIGIAGFDHVALGSDHGACRFELAGLETCARLPALEAALAARGLGPDAVGKIMGGNILGLMEAVVGE